MDLKKDYNITIYDCTKDGIARFTLGTSGNNPLICIGLNPSSANRVKPDPTVTKVIGFKNNDSTFDSFIMLNLYPQRATDPENIHQVLGKKLHNENIYHIVRILKTIKNPSVLCAWGDLSSKNRNFLIDTCLKDIFDATEHSDIKWHRIKGKFANKIHPLHPQYHLKQGEKYKYELDKFEFKKYVKTLNP